jgi:hypothetical protein
MNARSTKVVRCAIYTRVSTDQSEFSVHTGRSRRPNPASRKGGVREVLNPSYVPSPSKSTVEM